MEFQTIEKTIKINAPKEKVYDMIVRNDLNQIWFAEFCEGSTAQTDWQEGSKAIFTDANGDGIVGRIIENRPYETISILYSGHMKKGVEDYDSPEAKTSNGAREIYKISETDGVTELQIRCDTTEQYYQMMLDMWDKALEKLKETAEKL